MTSSTHYHYIDSQPENPFSKLVNNQKILIIPSFELESGEVLYDVPVAYKTWGRLNAQRNNVMIICHAFTGSADVADWWGPLLGKDKAFDPTKFFVICLNSLGSPYGSCSPVTINPQTGHHYGPEFPLCTIRDDVKIHKLVLDHLNVTQVACVIGGSMGGMLVLEYPSIFGPNYIRSIVALATSARHSAWCISWGEAQRQSIYSDPKYNDGYYQLADGPVTGLSAARMSALLTYRSRNSFESRFANKISNGTSNEANDNKISHSSSNSNSSLKNFQDENWVIHNDGHKTAIGSLQRSSSNASVTSLSSNRSQNNSSSNLKKRPQTFFTAQSYLRYQGNKFIQRFDPNCYIQISRKLDTHDLTRDRYYPFPQYYTYIPLQISVEDQLSTLSQPSLVVGISSDNLFTLSEQQLLADYLPNSEFYEIESAEGHDAFLLEFQIIDDIILKFLNKNLKDIMRATVVDENDLIVDESILGKNGNNNSVFGEAEDIINW
ncbi:homoserine O-acetyltransferase [Ascoidea rubescens DSM 1968]|uniref:Homoserine O-acetyltransferase n=1 Tax=Ascoidea rubescens DSM 1968 TaxID=1344418 RepID=A0A1D2VL21_9ASCO|nr:homoserine O-acetyltransferase [Ascoidea rubescens DSM 1968]ODV62310.1 homoserine O-acetyltransferase [Ascoidea rubescens DSM 1968]